MPGGYFSSSHYGVTTPRPCAAMDVEGVSNNGRVGERHRNGRCGRGRRSRWSSPIGALGVAESEAKTQHDHARAYDVDDVCQMPLVATDARLAGGHSAAAWGRRRAPPATRGTRSCRAGPTTARCGRSRVGSSLHLLDKPKLGNQPRPWWGMLEPSGPWCRNPRSRRPQEELRTWYSLQEPVCKQK